VRRAALLVALLAGCADDARARPSVLLVSIDTLRADHLGLYGYERETSPFLDRLGAESLVFEHAFTPAAWTLVAHMTMLTGLNPRQHGVAKAELALSGEAPLLAERLQAAGYQTLGFYRPGWIHPRHGFARGFEVFRAHATLDEAEAHLFEELEQRSPAHPTFTFLHLFDVHNDPSGQEPPAPFSAPAPYQDVFLPGARARLAGENYLTLKKKPRLDADEREALVSLYDDGIRHVDAGLERIFARLEAGGWLANTLVIVTSDHGESLAQRGKLTGHGGPYQEGVHVPLIVRLPERARAGTRIAESVHLIDVVQTVLDGTGLGVDPLLPGLSLLGALPSQRVLAGGDDPTEFYVRWPIKATRYSTRMGAVDLAQDPGELRPRPIEAEEFEALRRELGPRGQRAFEPIPAGVISAEEREDLRALGYGGEVGEEQ
jgi:arylsulfatase A-like enzyme